MTLRELETLLGRRLDLVRGHLGRDEADLEPVSPLRSPEWRRGAFRAVDRAGRPWKVRRLPSEEDAREVVRVLDAVADPRLARVVLRDGQVLVEEWVEGRVLREVGVDERRLAEAADILGHLHGCGALDGVALPRRASTENERLQAAARLDDLVRAGTVSPAASARLRDAVEEHDPGTAREGLCHGDFCGENLVVDEHGRLRVVDNELVALGPFALDLAVTCHRWPMSHGLWQRFLAHYRRHLPSEGTAEGEVFWRICAVVKSAHVRVVRLGRGGEVPLRALQALLGELAAPASHDG